MASTQTLRVAKCLRSIVRKRSRRSEPNTRPYALGSANLPELNEQGLWPAQAEAIHNLEESLKHGRPRALIQMATGSGKTFTAANIAYRLIKYAGARRILFLVDRANLGRQTLKEFQAFSTPDDGRKFTELYNVQRLGSNQIDGVSRVIISTIQRLYSILKGEPDLPEDLDEESAYELQPSKPSRLLITPRCPSKRSTSLSSMSAIVLSMAYGAKCWSTSTRLSSA